MGNLSGKRVLVTGAGQGLGYSIAEHFLEAGANVAAHYFSSEEGAKELKSLGEKKGRPVALFQGDLTKEAEATALPPRASEALGGLDILINNAGDMVQRRALEAMDTAYWEKVFAVNLTSLMWVTQAAVPLLAKSGQSSIVNLSSLAARNGGGTGSIAYASTKGAILTFTRGLAKEIAPKGIRVNAVTPGLIVGTRFHATHTGDAAIRELTRTIPLGRPGEPADVARAVLFLASEYDGFITGAALDINGGVFVS
ncbi:MAG TPA: SDR family NAD(P)-dependent oxidoreductase [Verrucomicrobiae bacterium]|jgi:3-oxoacyl-[acyl-carrier protein] reductase